MQIFTTKLVLVFNIGALGIIMICTYLFSHGHKRVEIVGWICAIFSLSVFAAPLTIMVRIMLNIYLYFYLTMKYFERAHLNQMSLMILQRKVIKTKSVEFMPFSLSFFLTLCAVMWFFYGFLIKDYYIAVSIN